MQLKVVLSAVALCLALVAGCSNVDPLIGQAGGANTAPDVPNHPIPGDGAVNSLLSTGLKWAGGDKDGDSVQYYLYFGTSATNMPLVATPKNGLFDSLNDLDFSTTYYWKIVANDGSATTEGPVWSFTTKSAPLAVAGWTLFDNGIPDNNVTALAYENTNVLWVGTRYAGLASLTGTAWTTYTGLPAYAINAICIDNSGKKWIGTWGGGLVRFGTQVDTVYRNDVFSTAMPDNRVNSLSISGTRDSLMVGGFYGKTSLLLTKDSVRAVTFTAESLSIVATITSTYPVHVFPATGSAIRDTVKYALDTLAALNAKNITIANLRQIYLSAVTNWPVFATDSVKLFNYSVARYPVETVFPIPVGSVSADTVMHKADSTKHRNDSLARYTFFSTGLTALRFNYNALNKYPAWVSMRDQAGKLWISTLNGIKIDGTYFTRGTFSATDTFGILVVTNTAVTATYKKQAGGLPSNSITCMADDGTKKWFGTPSGLAVLNGTTWTIYTTANSGLPSNKIQALAVGSANKIWIGTDAGLVVFDNP